MAVIDDIADFVDASAPGLGQADLIFVFGSTLPDAIAPAVRAFHAGLAPLIVLTGGPNRRNPALVESDAHARLLQAQGFPPEQMLIERRSRTSKENVLFARPVIEEHCDAPRTVIAVVFPVKCFCSRFLAAGLDDLCQKSWEGRPSMPPPSFTLFADSGGRGPCDRRATTAPDRVPQLVCQCHAGGSSPWRIRLWANAPVRCVGKRRR
jgi:DUF218 domain